MLADAIAQAIADDITVIDEKIDQGICPDCNSALEVISENTGYTDSPHIELSIICSKCGKDWTQGSQTEYPDRGRKPVARKFRVKGKYVH